MGIATEVIKNLFMKPSTRKYPKVKLKIASRYRGKLVLNKSKCKACGLCKTLCPTGAIKLTRKIKELKTRGKIYKLITHHIRSIDMGKCVFCGLCVDNCPSDAIKFTKKIVSPSKDKKKFIVKDYVRR